MEWRIITEGFQFIYDEYDIIISSYIVDGDSNTFKKNSNTFRMGRKGS